MPASLSQRLSAREQRLTVATAILFVASVLFFLIVKPLMSEWERFDLEIERKTEKRDLLSTILEMEEEINTKFDEYRELLAQESSDEAVRNELMQEINAISARSQLAAPVIREGSTESYKFHKRYFVDMDIAGAVTNVARFLANLQKSNQLFRVESLTISRRTGSVLNGRMEVSKILVPAGRHETVQKAEPAPESVLEEETEQNLLANGDMEMWSAGWGRDKYPDSWNGYRVITARWGDPVVSGFAVARVEGNVKTSSFWQEIEVKPATLYQITWHVQRISGWVSLQVRDLATKTYYEEARVPVESDAMRLYTQTFTTPGEPGGAKRTLQVTLFFHLPESAALVDDIRMVEVVTSEEETKEG
jgi:Tfp pilus assembly protein PilO